MLTVYGKSSATYCDRFSRRDFLKIGALAGTSLTLPNLLRLQAQGATSQSAAVPSGKSVIMIILGGGPSQLDLYDMKHWSERTVIALVMQTLDNSITTIGVKGRFGWRMTSTQGHGEPNPTYIPVAYEATRRMADVMGGTAGGNIGEPFERPLHGRTVRFCGHGQHVAVGLRRLGGRITEVPSHRVDERIADHAHSVGGHAHPAECSGILLVVDQHEIREAVDDEGHRAS